MFLKLVLYLNSLHVWKRDISNPIYRNWLTPLSLCTYVRIHVRVCSSVYVDLSAVNKKGLRTGGDVIAKQMKYKNETKKKRPISK